MSNKVTVVADSLGFVGAFSTLERAAAFIDPYRSKGVPFILYRYPVSPDSTKVYVVPYRGSDAVAVVTDDAAEARRVHAAFLAVGLTYEDDVSHWEQPVDQPCEPAIRRLNIYLEGMRLHGLPEEAAAVAREAEKKEEKLFDTGEGPITRMLREAEKLTMYDCVIPTANILDMEFKDGSGGCGEGGAAAGCTPLPRMQRKQEEDEKEGEKEGSDQSDIKV